MTVSCSLPSQVELEIAVLVEAPYLNGEVHFLCLDLQRVRAECPDLGSSGSEIEIVAVAKSLEKVEVVFAVPRERVATQNIVSGSHADLHGQIFGAETRAAANQEATL